MIMKTTVVVLWKIFTAFLILILFLGIVYFKYLSNLSALVVYSLTMLGIYIVPMFFTKQKRNKILLIENLALNFFFLIILTFLLIKSPGKPKQFVDENNTKTESSISEWDKVNIGGVDQWLLIKGLDKDYQTKYRKL